MIPLIFVVASALLGQARSGIVELNCSDNATCIDHMAKEFVRSLRQEKTIKLFDLFTIEPLGNRQGRSNKDPLTRLITTHAISFDWNDFTFRFSNPEDRSDALDLEVFESRSVKDVSDEVPKKSKGKDEEEVIEDKRVHIKPIKRRRHRRKVIQAVIPLLFGMKSAAVVIFALFMVSVITIKAFLASKMALMVTVGMALKKLYESYGTGVGLQNHPYLYSQYPIDFPSASSHAYSVSGVSPQFASPENMYSPTGLATHSHSHDLLQNDASAQQSQQAPSVLVNSTRAAERWDGKSKLLRYLEPMVDKIRSFVDPIASVFYDAMPATFRGLNSDVSTAKSVEPEVEEKVKRPREILVAQPRHIAQRKMTQRKSPRQKTKKYVEFKIDLNKLKHSKDFLDYIKTKKYKFNYPHTYYYPRIRYYINPNTYTQIPNNNRLIPNRKPVLRNILITNIRNNISATTPSDIIPLEPSDWKPIVVFNVNSTNPNANKTEKIRRKKVIKKRKRIKRSLDTHTSIKSSDVLMGNAIDSNNKRDFVTNSATTKRGFWEYFTDPFTAFIKQADGYTKKVIHNSLKSKKPPKYYTITYNLLMLCLDAIDGLVEVHEVIHNHLSDDDDNIKLKTKKKIKKKKKPISTPHRNNTLKAN